MLDSIVKVITPLGVVVAALWAYTRYVSERGLLPPVQFYVIGKKVGIVNDRKIIKVEIHLHNTGSATLIARNIRLDLRYITTEIIKDKPLAWCRGQRKAGRLEFPRSLIRDDLKLDPSSLIPTKIRSNKEKLDIWKTEKHRGFLILEEDTFVQPGIDQAYTFTTMIPSDTLCFLSWCSFQYAQKPSVLQKVVWKISRKLGLIQYSLSHATVPHTIEDVFWVADNAQLSSASDRQETALASR